MINSLKKNQIFVFGSNLAGKHIGGAARQALEQFGAIIGVGEGRQGQSYAFPTLDENFGQRSKEDLEKSVCALYDYCEGNKDQKFILTPVGTGIAGYSASFMASLFSNPPKNLLLPDEFKDKHAVILGSKGGKKRWSNLTPKQKSELGKKMVNARWKNNQNG